MTKADFLALNERQKAAGKELYVNPRNTAAGSLRQKDASITASRPLRFFAYAWGQMSEMPADTQSGMVKWLGKAGFHTNPIFRLCKSAEDLLDVYEEIGLSARNARLRYRRRRLQGRSARLAGAAWLRVAKPALGDRAQVSGRAGDDGGARHRNSGRAHRRADAGRQARAGRRRRRHRAERNAAQRGRDQAARCPHRRHGDDPARRRRDPAGSRHRRGEAAEGNERIRVPEEVSVPAAHSGRARGQLGRRRRACDSAAPANSPVRSRRRNT